MSNTEYPVFDCRRKAAVYANQHFLIVVELEDGTYTVADPPAPEVTVDDYDKALEDHLTAERTARGYTTREPDYYINSSVARWKQDATDWVAHRDEVMLYGLEIENKFIAGEPVPTLDEFKAALPKITWTLELTAEQD